MTIDFHQRYQLYLTLEGETINYQYTLRKLIGVGGYGAVFRADEIVANRFSRQVAVKIIVPEDDRQRERQLDELIASLNFDHPYLIRSFNAGEFQKDGRKLLYLAMELGEYCLQQRLEQGGLSTTEGLELVKHVASGLAYLHGENQIHRDLKPGNVLWVKNTWKLADFGLVRRLSTDSFTLTANPSGTFAYMPPEAFQGEISPAFDIWSLGIMIVAALQGGRVPYRTQDDLQLIGQIMQGALDLPSLPPEFDHVVRGCLHADRKSRWQIGQVLATVSPSGNSSPIQMTDKLSLDQPLKIARLSEKPAEQSSVFSHPVQTVNKLGIDLGKGVSLELVEVPGGSFLMGSPDGQGLDYEKPQHLVTVQSFWMGKYPITFKQWIQVARQMHTVKKLPEYNRVSDQAPVADITWYEAVDFCEQLPSLRGHAFRLPSEAEWEYACRAGTQGLYCYGDDEQQLADYGWLDNVSVKWPSKREIHPVGQKWANVFGLYDMHGNVWEWCEDRWHDNYKGAPTDGSAWDRSRRLHNDYRVIRGGGGYDPWECRSAYRSRAVPSDRSNNIGFRVVYTPRTLLPPFRWPV